MRTVNTAQDTMDLLRSYPLHLDRKMRLEVEDADGVIVGAKRLRVALHTSGVARLIMEVPDAGLTKCYKDDV